MESTYRAPTEAAELVGHRHTCHARATARRIPNPTATRVRNRVALGLGRAPVAVGVGVGQPEPNWVRASAMASAKSFAEGMRSAGVLANAAVTTCSTAGGTVSLTVRNGGTGSTICRASTVRLSRPLKGGSPASIS